MIKTKVLKKHGQIFSTVMKLNTMTELIVKK